MNEGILEAARAVRPYLAEYVGVAEATRLDDELARLLAGADGGEDVEAALRASLETREATRVFLERILGDAPSFRPPRVVAALTRSYSGLPGSSSPVSADKFRCPYGDYVWYRGEVGEPAKPCPTHQCALEPE